LLIPRWSQRSVARALRTSAHALPGEPTRRPIHAMLSTALHTQGVPWLAWRCQGRQAMSTASSSFLARLQVSKLRPTARRPLDAHVQLLHLFQICVDVPKVGVVSIAVLLRQRLHQALHAFAILAVGPSQKFILHETSRFVHQRFTLGSQAPTRGALIRLLGSLISSRRSPATRILLSSMPCPWRSLAP